MKAKHYQQNKSAIKQKHADYVAANSKHLKAYYAQYYANHKQERSAYKKLWLITLKSETLAAYGGCKCQLCQEKRLGALTIDHVAGGGKSHRRNIKCGAGHKFYSWLKKNGFPSGYRVLCSNCNWQTHLQRTTKNANSIRQRAYRQSVKAKAIAKLGGSCAVCHIADIEILSVHHINGDGAKHRRDISGGCAGHRFYLKLLKMESISGLECRCFSCNDAEAWRPK